jgi:hypothetical protein
MINSNKIKLQAKMSIREQMNSHNDDHVPRLHLFPPYWLIVKKLPNNNYKDGWKNVTTPKDKGGLGLKNMSTMNDALLTKHLHKLYNKEDVPWVQLV